MIRFIAIALVLLTAQAAHAGKYLPLIQAVIATYYGPSPNPPSPVTDECPNCGGTGKLGDGTVFVVCPACDGTGKRKKTQAAANPEPPRTQRPMAPVVVAPSIPSGGAGVFLRPDGSAGVLFCPDGTCFRR